MHAKITHINDTRLILFDGNNIYGQPCERMRSTIFSITLSDLIYMKECCLHTLAYRIDDVIRVTFINN